ncbi:MAG: tryptophan 7-halogenase, partial [Myxococcales bacterium]|nr:tryptophan 7-halogenase [Myxococcales bacterium]
DARHRRLLTLEEAGAWQPSRTTALVRIDAGVWLWQIPLARESLLSYGVVSRHGSIDEATYRSITAAHASPEFTLRGPRLDDAGPFSRLHRRDGFARQARTPADRDFILLADACAFSDPVYSVGAGFAVNTALQIAELLARGPWTRDACDAYCRRSRALMDRARAAFEFWYSGELLASPAAAREVQDAMLRGELFHEQLSGHYGDVLADSEYSGARDPFAPRVGAESLAPAARALLEIDDELVGWRLVGADPSESGVTLRFQRDALPILTVMVGRADGERCFQVIGPLALSYMQPAEGSYPDSPAFRGLLDAVATRLSRRADAWVALVDGDLSPAAASA